MPCRRLALGLLALTVAASAAFAVVGVSGALDPFRVQLDASRAAAEAQAALGDKPAKKAVKVIAGIVKLLGKPATSASYAGEMKAAARAAKVAAAKLSGDAALADLVAQAGDTYRADVGAARDLLADQIPTLSGGRRILAQAKLAKADTLLARADTAPSTSSRIAALAAAAKLLAVTPGVAALGAAGQPDALAIDATGRYLYVAEFGDIYANGTFHGDVRQMRISADGSVSYLAKPSVPGFDQPAAIVAHPSRGLVYVGNFGRGTVSQFSIGTDGTLAPLSPAEVAMPSDAGVVSMVADPTGKYVFAMGSLPGGSPVTAFLVQDDGTLTQTGFDYEQPYPVSLAVSPDGTRVYSTSRYRSTYTTPDIRVFSVDEAGAVASTGVTGLGTSCYGMVVDPTGSYLYAAHEPFGGVGTPWTIGQFDVSVATQVTAFGTEPTLGGSGSAVAMDPAGRFVYAARTGAAPGVAQFGVNADHTLSPLDPDGVATQAHSALLVTKDGARLYATNTAGSGAASNLVTVLAIGADGTLSLQ